MKQKTIKILPLKVSRKIFYIYQMRKEYLLATYNVLFDICTELPIHVHIYQDLKNYFLFKCFKNSLSPLYKQCKNEEQNIYFVNKNENLSSKYPSQFYITFVMIQI